MYRPLKASSDSELLSLLMEDSDAAFEEIYRRYFTKLYCLVKRRLCDEHQTEDIIQDLFLNIFVRSLMSIKLPLASTLQTPLLTVPFSLKVLDNS